MKIGILTFHWVANYGAILQAWALQTYLSRLGHEVYLIDYRPKRHQRSLLGCFMNLQFRKYLPRFQEYRKNRILEAFRREQLPQTRRYGTWAALQADAPALDVYITGSDQVWNVFYTTQGEGGPTGAYFLDFGPDRVKRLAYAVSFGCTQYPKEAAAIAQRYLSRFDGLSVREQTGQEMLRALGYPNVPQLLDPTLLLTRADYEALLPPSAQTPSAQTPSAQTPSAQTQSAVVEGTKTALLYVLRQEDDFVQALEARLPKAYRIESIEAGWRPESIEAWLAKIRRAALVVTNSFHGMVFALIFRVPFLVHLSSGASSGMNDRFYSLLKPLGLQQRIFMDADLDGMLACLQQDIDWVAVEAALAEKQGDTAAFFKQQLG